MRISCLFCKSDGPFKTQEHIIPESLGNDDLILNGHVCDTCQNYFGKEVENYVLGKTSFAAWRAILGIKTKSGRLPRVDLSQPKSANGRFPDKHPAHDDVIFKANLDGSCDFEIKSEQVLTEILSGSRRQFQFVMTPKVLCMTGRFLGKIGLELLCLKDPDLARTPEFDDMRNYARRGTILDIWPLFHFLDGQIKDLVWLEPTVEGFKEEILCFSYAIFNVDGLIAPYNRYTLLRFTIGTDNWVICLNDRYPHPIIRNQFKGHELKLIWYSMEELKKSMKVKKSSS
jgi:hypothetical protein